MLQNFWFCDIYLSNIPDLRPSLIQNGSRSTDSSCRLKVGKNKYQLHQECLESGPNWPAIPCVTFVMVWSIEVVFTYFVSGKENRLYLMSFCLWHNLALIDNPSLYFAIRYVHGDNLYENWMEWHWVKVFGVLWWYVIQ